MAVKTSDTNPKLSSVKIKEVLMLENEVDKHLLNHLLGGRTSYLVSATDKEVVEALMKRYEKVGWNVKLAYASDHLFRLQFEDPGQSDVTRKLKAIRPTPSTAGKKEE